LPKPTYNLYATLLDAFAWYKRSEDEGALQELLDKVNRKRLDPVPDPMLRGIAFEEIVDAFAHQGADTAADKLEVHDTMCPVSIFRLYAARLRGAVRQVDVGATLDTPAGLVRVYGKVDEILADCAYDIKTCAKYEFPKYLHNFQHPVYLEALRPMGIGRFVYMATDFKQVYEEEYCWTQEGRDRLVSECVHLVEFLENHRDSISDLKVFGLHELQASPL